MRFLADMGVDLRVVEWLRRHGHDAVHLREEGLHRAADERVFSKALSEDRIVLTFDLDFGDLAAFTREATARVNVGSPKHVSASRRPVPPLAGWRRWPRRICRMLHGARDVLD